MSRSVERWAWISPSSPPRRAGAAAVDRQRLLAVFAHPDDETFLAGGTLATYATGGWDVRLVCATRGEAGRRGPYEAASTAGFGELRMAELRAACDALGIGPPHVLDCADGGGASCAGKAQAATLELLRTFAPHAVITFGPDGISGHPDHLAVHQLVTTAFHEWRERAHATADADNTRAPVLYYVLRSASVPACCESRGPEPPPLTTVIDIAASGRRKLAAVRCHRSQSHLQPADAEMARRIVESPEHFHRAWSPWPGPAAGIETAIAVADVVASAR